jgi:hypothetical protein
VPTIDVVVPVATQDELEAMLADELAAVERLLNSDGRGS